MSYNFNQCNQSLRVLVCLMQKLKKGIHQVLIEYPEISHFKIELDKVPSPNRPFIGVFPMLPFCVSFGSIECQNPPWQSLLFLCCIMGNIPKTQNKGTSIHVKHLHICSLSFSPHRHHMLHQTHYININTSKWTQSVQFFLVKVVEARRAKNMAQKQSVKQEILVASCVLLLVQLLLFICVQVDPCCGRSFERHLEKEVKGVMFQFDVHHLGCHHGIRGHSITLQLTLPKISLATYL